MDKTIFEPAQTGRGLAVTNLPVGASPLLWEFTWTWDGAGPRKLKMRMGGTTEWRKALKAAMWDKDPERIPTPDVKSKSWLPAGPLPNLTLTLQGGGSVLVIDQAGRDEAELIRDAEIVMWIAIRDHALTRMRQALAAMRSLMEMYEDYVDGDDLRCSWNETLIVPMMED